MRVFTKAGRTAIQLLPALLPFAFPLLLTLATLEDEPNIDSLIPLLLWNQFIKIDSDCQETYDSTISKKKETRAVLEVPSHPYRTYLHSQIARYKPTVCLKRSF